MLVFIYIRETETEKETMCSQWMNNSLQALGCHKRGASAVGQFMSGMGNVPIHHRPGPFMGIGCGNTLWTSFGGCGSSYVENRNWHFAKNNGFFDCLLQGWKNEAVNNPVGVTKLGVDFLNSLLGGGSQQPQMVAYNPYQTMMPTMQPTMQPTVQPQPQMFMMAQQAPMVSFGAFNAAPQSPLSFADMQFQSDVMFAALKFQNGMRS